MNIKLQGVIWKKNITRNLPNMGYELKNCKPHNNDITDMCN